MNKIVEEAHHRQMQTNKKNNLKLTINVLQETTKEGAGTKCYKTHIGTNGRAYVMKYSKRVKTLRQTCSEKFLCSDLFLCCSAIA